MFACDCANTASPGERAEGGRPALAARDASAPRVATQKPPGALDEFELWLGVQCRTQLEDLAKQLHIGHVEATTNRDSAEVSWSNGAMDCDADAFTITVRRHTGPVRPWRDWRQGDHFLGRRDTRDLAIEVAAGYGVSKHPDHAREFRALARDAIDQCVR